MQYYLKLSELNAFIEATRNLSFNTTPEVSVSTDTVDDANAMQNIYGKLIGLLEWLKENELYEVD